MGSHIYLFLYAVELLQVTSQTVSTEQVICGCIRVLYGLWPMSRPLQCCPTTCTCQSKNIRLVWGKQVFDQNNNEIVYKP